MSHSLGSDVTLRNVTAVVDVSASVVAFVSARELWGRFVLSLDPTVNEVSGFAELVLWLTIAVTLVVRRPSSASGLVAGLDLYSAGLRNSFIAILLAAMVAFVLEIPARFYMLSLIFTMPSALTAARWCLRQVLRYHNRSSSERPAALLLGAHSELELTLKRDTSLGYCPITLPALATLGELESVIKSHNISALVLERHSGTVEELRELIWRAEELECRVMLASPVGTLSSNDVVVLPTATHNLTVLSTASLRPQARFVKRAADLLFAPLVIAIALPVLLVAMFVIAVFDGFPIFYRAERVGERGVPFTITKLRTMKIRQETEPKCKVEPAIASQSNCNSETSIPKQQSPRVTRVGRILRRWSIDELPQLFHVVAGTMSLVGPRPRLPHELSQHSLMVRRLTVKPGITGLWQVSGRGDIPLDEAIELDLRYVDSWTLFGDIVILMRTIKAVLLGQGAR